jgi:putative ABC transport system ATP-binding protein
VTAAWIRGPGAPGAERGGLAVSTHGLVHIYRSEGHDVAALAGVDLDIAPGEVVGLLGPSGAGKSTLLTLFGGLMRPSAGRIRVGHQDLTRMDEAQLDDYRAGDVGLILQGAARNLLPFLSPRDNVAFAQSAARGAGRPVPPVGEVLELVGLGTKARAPLTELTPGQLQLTALAVAMSTRPGLLLADEPTSQLDHEARDLVLDTLHDVNRRGRHDHRRRHPRRGGGRSAAPHRDHPRRPGRRRGPPRRGVCRGGGRRVPAAPGPRPRRTAPRDARAGP